ncbi:peptidase S1 [Dermatophagoides farinae]|uniref:Peptidase S1 n=1 Tax=Dermatophagoides farinae TaxID=6954 RepID=A0A922HKB0_DERFA|nr:peptidase S1 [Dermatophagoides farinae]
MHASNAFCLRPLYDAYCPNSNNDEECCLEIESPSTLDTMTKNFIKLIQQTVAMNQTKNIGAEFQQHSVSSSTPYTITTTTTTTTTQSSLPQCDGTCVVPLFHMLCDEIDHNQYCAHGYCCVNRDEIISTTTTMPTISPCDGTCLPVILSGMCTKPSELVLKTLDCGTGTICCARGKIDQSFQSIIPGLSGSNNNYPNHHQISIQQQPPRVQLPLIPVRKNNHPPSPLSSSSSSTILMETGNNKVHFRPPTNIPDNSGYVPTNDDNIMQSSSSSINEQHNFICPGKCINSMFKFTCLGGYSINKHFKCSTKGQICCASNVDIEKLEIFLHNTKMVQQQVPPLPQPPPQQQQQMSQASKPNPTLTSQILQPSNDNNNNNKPPVAGIVSIAAPIMKPPIITHSPVPIQSSNNENMLDLPPLQQQQQHQKQSSHVCGIKGSKRSQRVVGGSDSYPGEWCWQIALVNQQNKYICGGVLIGKQWALTAAHCVTNYLRKNEAIFIRAGEYDLTRNNRFGQMQKVQTIYVHHNHNSQSLDNDIALMKLLSPIELNPNTCLVCLPTWNTNRSSSSLSRDKQCTVTGYGFQHESGPIALRIREALIPIVDDQQCIMKINSVTEKQFILPASSFCAGGHGGNDACQGDGGSGLVCHTIDGYYELTGLVSWGFGCGRNGVPGVYVKILAFIGWINQIVSTNA